ncbi:MAG TPA: sigma-70 factor domain-containing protein, partial [Myxococcaceae bacterium]|nr:sigma-70 factor domain-containing protein [Myxococcaceae bacterium]
MASGSKKTRAPASRTRAKRPVKAPAPEEAEVEAEAAPESEPGEPDPRELEEVDAEIEEVPVPARAPLVRRTEAGLTRADPLQAYMSEVQRHPLLTREEELALARHYRDTGDVQAAYRL